MEKPLITKIDECKKQISKALNDSQLTPSILELILKDFCNEMLKQKAREYQMANKSVEEVQNGGRKDK